MQLTGCNAWGSRIPQPFYASPDRLHTRLLHENRVTFYFIYRSWSHVSSWCQSRVSRSAAWRAFFFVASPAGTRGGTWWVHSREAPVGRAAAHTTPPTWRRAVAGRSLAPTPGW